MVRNIIRTILNREQGLDYRLDYNIALSRLKCYREDVYRGLSLNCSTAEFIQESESPVFACNFCSATNYQHIIALANEDGRIVLQDTMVKDPKKSYFQGTQAHLNAIFDITWMPNELKLVTASGDHTARLWDVSEDGISELKTFQGHTRSIKSIAFRHQDKAVFATGGRDGAIMLWDIRATQTKPDNTIFRAHDTLPNHLKSRRTSLSKTHSQSITALGFQNDVTLISCSTGDGLIKVWDIRKNYTAYKKEAIAKHIMKYGGESSTRNGFASLLVCPAGITLYASCMDNKIYAYNISSYNSKPVAEYFGHENSTFYVKSCLSPDGKYLASGSSDENAYIWQVNKPGSPLLKLTGHTEEVTCIAWCKVGETKIVTCSDDSCHRIWRVSPNNTLENDQFSICGWAETIQNSIIGNKIVKSSPQKALTKPGLQKQSEYLSESTTNSGLSSFVYNIGSKRSFSEMSEDICLSSKNKVLLTSVEEKSKSLSKRMKSETKSGVCNAECNKDDVIHTSSEVFSKVDFCSPTSNLPNFVVDGTAPHLLSHSPQKSKENVNWLTKIIKERYGLCNSTKVEKSSLKNNGEDIIGHRNKRFRSAESKRISNIQTPPLLQYFKSTIKSSEQK